MGESGISYLQAGYKRDKWKWVLSLPNREQFLSNPNIIKDELTENNLYKAYELDKLPKVIPCPKKCNSNPWCLANISSESRSKRICLTEQPRKENYPIGLENTANTCWINSALQSLFHLQYFRSCINSVEGFIGEESLDAFIYILQAMFVEMDFHKCKALACTGGSIFEKLAVFASKNIMQKDQDFEVLKCVSEFLENTIDNLLDPQGIPNTETIFSPLFKISKCQIARWKCTSCKRNHKRQLPLDTSYTMAAYVISDECPLEQCILDLQTETQTGVWLECGKSEDGSEDGCGASVKVDRIVTPQILSLPHYLIIRNNSLVDSEARRRNHVIYPETLDLSKHTCNSETATYSLQAVIFHHGHWIQHFTAHVKTDKGKWYSFNDEKVDVLVKQTGVGVPSDVNKDYFSLGPIAAKYRNPKVRVSRGAFIWIYERNVKDKGRIDFAPPQAVVNYVRSIQINEQIPNEKLLMKVQQERRESLAELSVLNFNVKEEVCTISQAILSSWMTSSQAKFTLQPYLAASGMCEHGKLNPYKINSFRCIRKDKGQELFSKKCGIHCEASGATIMKDLKDSLCRLCVAKHVHHILFRNSLKELKATAKKLSSKDYASDHEFIGINTIDQWPYWVLNSYLNETGLIDLKSEENLDTDISLKPVDELEKNIEDNTKLADSHLPNDNNLLPDCTTEGISRNGSIVEHSQAMEEKKFEGGLQQPEETKYLKPVISLFNEDVICQHNMLNPCARGFWVPTEIFNKIKNLCVDHLHPSIVKKDFDSCNQCEISLSKSVEVCAKGRIERKILYQLYLGRRRPSPNKDKDVPIFLLSKQFLIEWRNFIRACEKNNLSYVRPDLIDNSVLLCKHQKLFYKHSNGGLLDNHAVLTYEEEWKNLIEYYSVNETIKASFDETGLLVVSKEYCDEGCIEAEADRNYEDNFNFEFGEINVFQVNSVKDVPQQQNGCQDPTEETEIIPRKRSRYVETTNDKSNRQKLVRTSKMFSCTDTLKDIQNFIADKTGIWPLLQTLWLPGSKEHGPDPFSLKDEHRPQTLRALRIKPGDIIYFKAAIEDLEKAAGDGITEYEELDE